MKKTNIKYTNESIGPLKIVDNFLPPPESLIFKKKTTKVTLELSEECVLYFKKKAKENHTQYQKMIRSLLDHYIAFFNAI